MSEDGCKKSGHWGQNRSFAASGAVRLCLTADLDYKNARGSASRKMG